MRETPTFTGRPSEVPTSTLRHWYDSEQMSYQGIADRLGCSRTYVMKLFRQRGLTPRSRSIARIVAIKNHRLPGHVLRGTPEFDPSTGRLIYRGSAARSRRWRARQKTQTAADHTPAQVDQ